MSRKKSNKYTGVYYQELLNGDKSYYITYKYNKKDIWKKIGLYSEGIREAYCSQKRNEIVSKIRLGEELPHFAKNNKNKILIVAAEEFYELKKMYNKANKKTSSRIIGKIKKHYIGNMPINEIKQSDMEKFQSFLEKEELMPSTINFTLQQVSSIFNWLIQNKELNENPLKYIKYLKVKNMRMRFLEKEEIKKLLYTIENDKILYYFVLLSLTTGGRLQTICNIKPSDIKENNTIRLYDFKNESEYFGFIEENLRKEIVDIINLFKIKNDDYIFKCTEKHSYTNQYYYRKLQPIFDILFNTNVTNHLNKVTIHTLRHTFASHLAINGTPIITIKKLMNHDDIKTTMRYAKLSPDSGKDAINNLGFFN